MSEARYGGDVGGYIQVYTDEIKLGSLPVIHKVAIGRFPQKTATSNFGPNVLGLSPTGPGANNSEPTLLVSFMAATSQ